jgi:hypothetical protein
MTYENIGASPWVLGTPLEVKLVFSPSTSSRARAWGSASGVLAVQPLSTVNVLQEATFTFPYTVAADTTTGTYSLIARPILGGQIIGPDGTCQVSVTAGGGTAPDPRGPEPSEPPPDPI